MLICYCYLKRIGGIMKTKLLMTLSLTGLLGMSAISHAGWIKYDGATYNVGDPIPNGDCLEMICEHGCVEEDGSFIGYCCPSDGANGHNCRVNNEFVGACCQSGLCINGYCEAISCSAYSGTSTSNTGGVAGKANDGITDCKCPSGQTWATCPEGPISCTPKCCPADKPYLDKEGNCSECVFHAQCPSQVCSDGAGCNDGQWCRQGQCCGERTETISWAGGGQNADLHKFVTTGKSITSGNCHYKVLFTHLDVNDSFAVKASGNDTMCIENEWKAITYQTMGPTGLTKKTVNMGGYYARSHKYEEKDNAVNSYPDSSVGQWLIHIGGNEQWGGKPVSDDETRTIYYLPAGQTLEFFVKDNSLGSPAQPISAGIYMELKLIPQTSITGGCGHWVQKIR